jgi:hypothetical protein
MAEARAERRLAAILAADVADFSHLTCRERGRNSFFLIIPLRFTIKSAFRRQIGAEIFEIQTFVLSALIPFSP